MKTNNIVQQKSRQFAIAITRLCRNLQENQREYVLSKQLLRSGTSIGANIEEAIGAHTRADFAYKMATAYKEARESKYWLQILLESELISLNQVQDSLECADELCRILGSIQKTLKG